MPAKLLYAQSGGVTAVINATAAAVIEQARRQGVEVLCARNGILGVHAETLYETRGLSVEDLAALARTPGGAFGSCRFDLPDEVADAAFYERVFAVLAAHRISYLLYNGGNGSMDAVLRLDAAARRRGYPLVCVGVPKTIDNDLLDTDCCPGFGSAARYLATSMREAALDVESMSSRRGRVFVLEVMGRNSGWLAAATALAADRPGAAPHLVLFPERPVETGRLLEAVRSQVEQTGYCAITVAEGIRDINGRLLAEQESAARADYVQLGGAGAQVAQMISAQLGYKHHYAVPDYLQRAAGHWVSGVDYAQARAVGAAAVDLAIAGQACVMPAIRRQNDAPYRWDVHAVDLAPVANRERRLPDAFIRPDGMGVTEAALAYLRPLVEGEVPCQHQGIPDYWSCACPLVPRLLPDGQV